MASLSFRIAVRKNEAKLSSFVQFENEIPRSVTERSTTSFVLTVLEHSHVHRVT